MTGARDLDRFFPKELADLRELIAPRLFCHHSAGDETLVNFLI